jgi:hypothetical protein
LTSDAIEPVATVTYLGPNATATMFHATQPIGFRIEEVGGERLMGGGTRLPCLSTELAKGASTIVAFGKSGSPDDPKNGFDLAWYEDPVLRLPAGTWRLIATLNVNVGTGGACGVERHRLTVENVVQVVAGETMSPTPNPTPSPIPSPTLNPVPSLVPSPAPVSSTDGRTALATVQAATRLSSTST